MQLINVLPSRVLSMLSLDSHVIGLYYNVNIFFSLLFLFSLSRVYISPDLTSEERAARGVLVKKLKEEKEKSPEKSFRIKGGEVVEVFSKTQ